MDAPKKTRPVGSETQGKLDAAKKTRSAGADTQSRILRSAEKIFRLRGYDGATMDDIASDAAVEKANIYYYFKGKEQLHQALSERTETELQARINAAAAQSDPWARLETLVTGVFAAADALPGLIPLAFDGLVHPLPKGHDLHVLLEKAVRDVIAYGAKKGAFKVSATVTLTHVVEGALMRTLISRGDADPTALLALFRKLLS